MFLATGGAYRAHVVLRQSGSLLKRCSSSLAIWYPSTGLFECIIGRRIWGASMDITEVRVFPVEEDKLKAYVTITLDNCFVIRDLKVIHGNTGLFIAMPAKRRKDGTYKDIAHPLNADTRERMERAILLEYERQSKRPPLFASGIQMMAAAEHE
jgi:stage V sporulation protein G